MILRLLRVKPIDLSIHCNSMAECETLESSSWAFRHFRTLSLTLYCSHKVLSFTTAVVSKVKIFRLNQNLFEYLISLVGSFDIL